PTCALGIRVFWTWRCGRPALDGVLHLPGAFGSPAGRQREANRAGRLSGHVRRLAHSRSNGGWHSPNRILPSGTVYVLHQIRPRLSHSPCTTTTRPCTIAYPPGRVFVQSHPYTPKTTPIKKAISGAPSISSF